MVEGAGGKPTLARILSEAECWCGRGLQKGGMTSGQRQEGPALSGDGPPGWEEVGGGRLTVGGGVHSEQPHAVYGYG